MGKKWIWQSENYPNFLLNKSYTIFDFSFDDCLGAIFDRLARCEKKLNQIISQSNLSPILLESKIAALTDEIVNSASIEGEILKRESVRSSLRKKLDKEFNFINDNSSTKQSDNYASILLDTNLNKSPLTIERLHGWHNCLFESGYSGLHKINIAKFRKDEMQVISGGIGKEKIHYEAIPAKNIQKDMQAFLRYCNNTFINPYAKSAIAHLWFVIIHPYDDGNGRIARAIADFTLPNKNVKLYSISSQINTHKKAYYDILERTNRFNANCDITEWLQWHLSITESAMQKGIDKINQIIFKTKFWDNFKELKLTRSQHKVLGKMLDIGIKDFGGFLSVKKYSRISKVDIQTASKEIDELCRFGCLVKKTNSFSNEFFTLPQDFAVKPLNNKRLSSDKASESTHCEIITYKNLKKSEIETLSIATQQSYKAFVEDVLNGSLDKLKYSPNVLYIGNLNEDLAKALGLYEAKIYITKSDLHHSRQIRKKNFNQDIPIENYQTLPNLISKASEAYIDNIPRHKNFFLIEKLNDNEIASYHFNKDLLGNYFVTARRIEYSKLKQKEYTLVRSGIEPHIEEQAPSLPSGSSLTSDVNVSKNAFKSQVISSEFLINPLDNESTLSAQSQTNATAPKSLSDIPQPRVSRVKEILAGGVSKAQESAQSQTKPKTRKHR